MVANFYTGLIAAISTSNFAFWGGEKGLDTCHSWSGLKKKWILKHLNVMKKR